MRSLKETCAQIRERIKVGEVEVQRYKNALFSLQSICVHDWKPVADQVDAYECGICGVEDNHLVRMIKDGT